MALTRDRDGKRLHVKSRLMGESLVSHKLIDELELPAQERLFPNVSILKIGGQSICDRGKHALPQVIDEIAHNKKKHKMLLTTGGGTRSRHIYSIGLELGMPTGIIAKFGSTISEQNALLVSVLLAPHGGILIDDDSLVKLSQYFAQGSLPVIHGMPPYDLYALPPAKGRIPIHRTDVGTLILADLLGVKNVIFIKDEKGLYTGDPKKDPGVKFISKVSADELQKMELDDLIIERPCLDILKNSSVIKSIQIINGLEKGNITKSLNGKHVGTIIYSS
ncbi:MAG TPA: uridine kinase [Spirochaetota bacterium]|nr:uridine kinase [Spirochaetota bacterium]